METTKLFCVSLGCDKNLVDTEKMLALIRDLGVAFTDSQEEADIILINTCCFIGDAKEESVNTILEMAEEKKEGRCKALIVTGCLAQRLQRRDSHGDSRGGRHFGNHLLGGDRQRHKTPAGRRRGTPFLLPRSGRAAGACPAGGDYRRLLCLLKDCGGMRLSGVPTALSPICGDHTAAFPWSSFWRKRVGLRKAGFGRS